MRKKYVPTRNHLKKAWTWKRKGETVGFICKKVGITVSQYRMNTHIFNSHFKQMKKTEKFLMDKKTFLNIDDIKLKKGNMYKNGETKLLLEDIDLELLRSYVIAGFTKEKISQLMGISRTTLYQYKDRFPEVKNII